MDITLHTIAIDAEYALTAEIFTTREAADAREVELAAEADQGTLTHVETHTVRLPPAPYEGADAVPVEGIDTPRITEALNEGLGAFWAAVVRVFPEVESGDMDPDGQLLMASTMANVLAAWLTYNHPTAHES